LWLHSLKVAQLLRSAACLHTNQSRSYLNHLVQTGRTAAIRLHKEVKMVDPDDEARSLPSPPFLNAMFRFTLSWPTLTSPQRLSMAKVNRVAGRQLGTNCGTRESVTHSGKGVGGRSKGLLFCNLSRSNPMHQQFYLQSDNRSVDQENSNS